MKKLDSKSYGKSFCVYPWVEQVVQTSGGFSFCCVAQEGGLLRKPDGGHYNASKDKLSEAWNSESMQEIRRKMLNGEKVDACKLCYFQESIDKKSYRQMHNQEWEDKAGAEIRQRIEDSVKNNHKVNEPALYLDLRLGNLCNLKCRSCNPYNSSQIFKETKKLLVEDEQFKNVWTKYFSPDSEVIEPWFESDFFWDEVIKSIPKLKKVYLTGGEPTLIEKNYKFLNACVESGHAKNIFLMFNTNCTNIQDRFLDLLPHFEFVLINASIDGFESENEYIRSLSRWETVDKNFQKLLSIKGNIQVGITPVVQIYNILTITNLLEYVDKMTMMCSKAINVDFLYATHPECLDLSMLPKSIKTIAAEKLEKFKKRSKNYGRERFLTNSVDSCINLLNGSDDKFSDSRIKDFVNYTQALDRNRKQDFKVQFPELNQLLNSEGYSI